MKTETKTPEKKLLHFNEANFNKVKNVVTLLAATINEKPVPTNDPMSVRALARNGLKNDSFLSLCEEAGIIPDENLFQNILKNGLAVIGEELVKDVTQPLKETVRISNEPLLKRFSTVITQLKTRLATETHHVWLHTQKVYSFEKFISFIGGRAVVTPETMEALKEDFKTFIDSESKVKAYELLDSIAYLTNHLRQLQNDKNLVPFALDYNWFSEMPDGKIIPNPEIIKYC
jgi:hypothetical protein